MVSPNIVATPAVLVAWALCSAVDLLYATQRRSTRRYVQLRRDDDVHPSSSSATQPFGVVSKVTNDDDDDDVDGTPLDEPAFWRRMRSTKAGLGLVLFTLLALRFFAFGWDAVDKGIELARKAGVVEDALILVFWAINILILSKTWSARSVEQHWRPIVHLSMLTFVFVVCTWGRLLLPTSVYRRDDGDTGDLLLFDLILVWGEAALGTLAFTLAVTTPRGPYLSFKPDYADSEPNSKTFAPAVIDPKNHRYGNVSLLASCSVLDLVFFGWVTPIMRIGSSKDQFSEADLPSLTAQFRALNLYNKITSSIRQASVGQTGRYKTVGAAPRIFNPLLWRVIVVNKTGFGLQALLALINAFLYYLPALFLQRIVHFMEVKPPEEQETAAFGYAYCAGLLFSMLFEAIVSGQLWYLSNSLLCARIKTQLNTAIYAKTLRRKDIAGLSAFSKADIAQQRTDFSDLDPVPQRTFVSADVEGAPTLVDQQMLANEELAQRSTSDVKSTTQKTDDTNGEDEAGFGTKSQVLNLFTIDVDRIADFSIWSFSLIDSPLEVVIGTVFLYQLLGVASLIGVASSALFLPFNHYTSKYFAQVQDKLMAARDRRVSLMNEVLSSIRMIKYMAWEAPFEAKILRSRDDELKHLRYNFLLEISFQAIWLISPIVCILVSFLWYTKVQGQVLTPSTAFTALAVFQELKFALNTLPETLINGLQCLVSLRRIEKYFATPEVDRRQNLISISETLEVPVNDDLIDLREDNGHASNVHRNVKARLNVCMRNATISWPSNYDDDYSMSSEASDSGIQSTPMRRRFRLEDITVDFPIGQLSLVCGSLGSGKTLLLLALLGETDLLSGQIVCPRSPPNAIAVSTHLYNINPESWLVDSLVAYVPQQAFLQNASIRLNILFGLPHDEFRYAATLEACSLNSDLKIFEDGDATEIGEKGVILSGGQKARISLARAVYSRAKTLLFDDVLSAVDAHTARHITEKCLCGPLLRGRTVILVSHHVQLCAPLAEYVLCLSNGLVSWSGSGYDFKQSEQFSVLSGGMGGGEDDDVEDNQVVALPELPKKLTNKVFRNVQEHKVPEFDSGTSSPADSEFGSSDDDEEDEESDVTRIRSMPSAKKLIDEESRAVGHVSWNVWKSYIRANGSFLFYVIFATVFIGSQVINVAETYILSLWTASNDGNHPERRGKHSTEFYLALYSIVSVLNVVIDTARWVVVYNGSLRASKKLHKSLLHAVLRAPLRWFDKMSLGRLINRFAKDQEGIDSSLPDTLGRAIMDALAVITAIATIAWVTPLFVVAFSIACIGYYRYAVLYAHTARECRRLDSVSKSPLYAVYSETIAGAALIRAFGGCDRFMTLALQRIDTNVRFFYFLWSCNRWLSIRFSLLSGAVVGLTGFFLLQARDRVEASLAGFALTFALSISSDVLFLVRRVTAVELALVSVERVKEYSEVELEAPPIVEPRPPASWPRNGEVAVQNLSVRYAHDLPDVLHDISFRIPPGKKVGIVGPTGCGKSTLAQSFFRFIEARAGYIKIDGLDISNIGLADLRSALTIIPQDPSILSGSLRSTLDVFNEYTDQEIFESLRRVALIPHIDDYDADFNENVFRNLDTEISEQGSNISSGQRQLLCMARALLKRSKVILLDEATSSIDYESDALVNKTIRTEFADSTLLVIAHRLRTIIDFDYVLVLEAGRVVEYDAPGKLLANPDSRFHSLCRATGKGEFRTLRKISEGREPTRRTRRRKSSGKRVEVVTNESEDEPLPVPPTYQEGKVTFHDDQSTIDAN